MLLSPRLSPANRSKSGSPETRTIPTRHREREQVIHRICLGIKGGLARGEYLQPLVRRAVRCHNGRIFKSDPLRKLALCEATLLRAWYAWKKGGELPCAVRHQWNPAGPSVPAWVVLRFNDLVTRVEFPNMRAAVDELCRRRGWGGHGQQPNKERFRVSYGQLCHHFGGANFREAQARIKAIADAQAALAELRLKMDADIRRRLPDKPKRNRRTGS